MSDRNNSKKDGGDITSEEDETGEKIETSYDDDGPLHEKINTVSAWVIVIGAFFAGGIASMLFVPYSNWLSFMVFGGLVSVPLWAILTESGLEWLNNLDSASKSNTNTQTVNSSPKRICSSCGWQNEQTNNYCIDCGTELGD